MFYEAGAGVFVFGRLEYFRASTSFIILMWLFILISGSQNVPEKG